MLIEFEISEKSSGGRDFHVVLKAENIRRINSWPGPETTEIQEDDGTTWKVKGSLAEVREKWEKALGSHSYPVRECQICGIVIAGPYFSAGGEPKEGEREVGPFTCGECYLAEVREKAGEAQPSGIVDLTPPEEEGG